MLNPDLLSEVDFCRLCGFVFTDKRRKKNKGEFAKMFDSGPGGRYSHTLPIRGCAAQRGRDFEAPDLERGIHFRGVF